MDEIFPGSVNFDALLRQVSLTGGAFEPHAMSRGAIRAVSTELEQLEFTRYRRGPEWPVRECYEVVRARHHERADMPVLTSIGDELGWQARLPSIRGLNNRLWYPNYVNVLRYYAESEDAISVHRDFSYDHYLIGVLTVEGYTEFAFHGESVVDDPVIWQLGPGSLVLMRGTGLDSSGVRPYHEPKPPKQGRRTALVYRMDIRLIEQVEAQLADSGGAYDD